MSWYLEALKKYAVFTGRARRKEFWFYSLFNMIALIVAMIVDNVLGLRFEDELFGPIYTLYILATLLPSLAVSVRRLHDVGKSGWFLLLNLIPFIGPIWLLILVCGDSAPGGNQYGANPKA